MILKSDKIPEFTEEEKRAFAEMALPEERTNWETESDARIALHKRVWHLRCENAYLKGKVEVLEGFATRRLIIKESKDVSLSNNVLDIG